MLRPWEEVDPAMDDARPLDLAAVPVFATLSDRQRRLLVASGIERTYEAGTTVVSEGAPGDEVFVVVSGRAGAVRRGRRVAAFGPGDLFGETAALAGGGRSASIVAETELRCLVVPRDRFMKCLVGEPRAARSLLETMARRTQQIAGGDAPDGG
jgi:CRP-like cAMP-binding protein